MAKKDKLSRRGFVVKSAMGLGGLGLAPYSKPAHYLEEKTVKLESEENVTYFGENDNLKIDKEDVVIENDDFKLVIGSNAIPKSLLSKSTGEECLMMSNSIPISTITQQRPYQNEIKLAYSCDEKTFK